MKHTWES